MITLLLAELGELHGSFSDAWRLRFARAGQSPATPLFAELSAEQWPVVEATYRFDTGNEAASDRTWLRFDPATAQPDINGVVMLGFGAMLNISDAERAALLSTVSPLLEERGVTLHWPVPERAYLGVPSSLALPEFTATWDVLGEDLLEHFPGGELRDEASRWWRSLINDVQIALHDHPVNQQRRLQRVHPVNLLWPWRNAEAVVTNPRLKSNALLHTPDPELRAMWDWAGGDAAQRNDASVASWVTGAVIDLRDVTRCATLEREWFEPVFDAMRGTFDVRFGETVLHIRRLDRWKFWIK